MKITGYELVKFEGKAERPIGDANGPQGSDYVGMSILILDTDEGLQGFAPLGNDYIKNIFPVIENQDPRSVKGLWKKMTDLVFKDGNEGEKNHAISALDIALWDLKAKINQEPLWKTLGASTNLVKAYASGIDMCLDDNEISTFYGRMAQRGIDAGKLKVGLDLESDLKRISIMKDSLSKNNNRPHICIDSNEFWSPKQAVRYINEIETHFDITWAEEPARRWDYAGLKKVSDGIKAAVATGENLNSISDYTPLIRNGGVDIVQVGMNTTGITGALQVANLAYAYELPVAMMNCPGNIMAHLAAVLPNHFMMEVIDNGRELCFNTDQNIEEGFIVMGDSPGLGLNIDFKKLDSIKVDKFNPPIDSPPFSRAEGAGFYPPKP